MKESILFLNNQEIKDLGGEDMQAMLHDCQRAYVLMEEGDVLACSTYHRKSHFYPRPPRGGRRPAQRVQPVQSITLTVTAKR